MATALKPGFTIRNMLEADIDAVIAIERSAYDFPWTVGIFKDCLKSNYHCWVMQVFENLAGYVVMSIAARECHLLNICIAKHYRRQGLATKFMQYLLQFARSTETKIIYLEVRPSNISAIQLYQALGFAEIGVRKNYYPCDTGREDALVLALPVKS